MPDMSNFSSPTTDLFTATPPALDSSLHGMAPPRCPPDNTQQLHVSAPHCVPDAAGLEDRFAAALRTESSEMSANHQDDDRDWSAAAQAVIDGCTHLPEAQSRVQFLGRLCDELGPAQYPAFIGVLCTIGERGTREAAAAVAGTLVESLCCGCLPSGRRAAWGSMSMPASGQGGRSLGPVEYLCAWHAQAGAQAGLAATHFDRALRPLLALLSQDDATRAAFCDHLRAVARDPMDGALSRSVRDGLLSLADGWQACGDDLHVPVDAFMQCMKEVTDTPSGFLSDAWNRFG